MPGDEKPAVILTIRCRSAVGEAGTGLKQGREYQRKVTIFPEMIEDEAALRGCLEDVIMRDILKQMVDDAASRLRAELVRMKAESYDCSSDCDCKR